MLTFHVERLSDVRAEAEPLLKRHWEEIALNKDKVPLDPDWPVYAELEKAGFLLITTARNERGELNGYVADVLHGALHYRSQRVAENDIFWLAPERRGGLEGFRLLRAADANAVSSGANKFVKHVKIHSPGPGKLLERMGYVATDIIYAKVL